MIEFEQPFGATPLSQDDLKGLIPFAQTREQLNDFEQRNIVKGINWLSRSRKVKISTIFDFEVINMIHKKMFNETWKWAGTYRTQQTNIGVMPHQIPSKLQSLCENAKYWLEEGVYSHEQLGLVFHHKLVSIHPYPNGNGRHSRVVADHIYLLLTGKRYSWGQSQLLKDDEVRREYIKALRKADNGDYNDLFRFGLS